MLDSALARPRNLWLYDESSPDLARLAASIAYGIVRNHPFVDGNKRVGYVACLLFLRLNGKMLTATPEEKYHAFISLADGTNSEQTFAVWLREHLQPQP